MSYFRKKLSVGIGSALLLSGLQLGAPVCLAQTAPAMNALTASPAVVTTDAPRSARDQALEKQLVLCAQPIDLQVRGATLADVVQQVRIAMPEASINLRLSAEDKALQKQVDEGQMKLGDTILPQFRFAVEQQPLGDILRSAATLAGYEFFILPDELLITQRKTRQEQDKTGAPKLSNAELAQGSTLMRQVSQQIGKRLFELSLKQGTGKEPTTILFGELAPELQQQLQAAVGFRNRTAGSSSISVPANAPITLDNLDKGSLRFTLTIAGANPTTDIKRVYAWGADVSSAAEDQGGKSIPLVPRQIPVNEKEETL